MMSEDRCDPPGGLCDCPDCVEGMVASLGVSTEPIAPLGVMPRGVFEAHRLSRLAAAIERRRSLGETPRPEWYEEYYDRNEYLRRERSEDAEDQESS